MRAVSRAGASGVVTDLLDIFYQRINLRVARVDADIDVAPLKIAVELLDRAAANYLVSSTDQAAKDVVTTP